MTDIQPNVESAALELLKCLDASMCGGIKRGKLDLYGIEVQVVIRLNRDAFESIIRKASYLSASPPELHQYPAQLFGFPVRVNIDGTSAPPISIALEPTTDILGARGDHSL